MEELSQAADDIDAIAREGLFETALNMQEEMQNSVPILTGRLWDHILIDGPHSDGNYHFVEVGIIHNLAFTPKDVAIQANVIEFGSSRQAAQPFLRPVFRKKKSIFWKAFQMVAAKYGYHFELK
jgi:hypothetical protein